MTHFFKKITPYLLIVICMVAVRYVFYKKIFYDGREKPRIEKTTFNDAIIIMGDSKSQFGFNDSMIAATTNKPYFNVSQWSFRPLNNLELLDKYTIKNSTVFVSVSSRLFLYLDTISLFIQPNNFSDLFNFNLNTFLKTNIKHTGMGRWEYTISPHGSHMFVDLKRRYQPYLQKEDSTIIVSQLTDSTNEYFLNRKIIHLATLIKKLNAANNKVILICLPERPCYNRWAGEYDIKFARLIKEGTGLPLYNFGTYPDSLFYDSHHLNKNGSVLFTKAFLDQFSKEIR